MRRGEGMNSHSLDKKKDKWRNGLLCIYYRIIQQHIPHNKTLCHNKPKPYYPGYHAKKGGQPMVANIQGLICSPIRSQHIKASHNCLDPPPDGYNMKIYYKGEW